MGRQSVINCVQQGRSYHMIPPRAGLGLRALDGSRIAKGSKYVGSRKSRWKILGSSSCWMTPFPGTEYVGRKHRAMRPLMAGSSLVDGCTSRKVIGTVPCHTNATASDLAYKTDIDIYTCIRPYQVHKVPCINFSQHEGGPSRSGLGRWHLSCVCPQNSLHRLDNWF